MKYFLFLFLFILLSIPSNVSAQDTFQKDLFSVELIMKYRNEIGLTEEKATKIREIYTSRLSEFELNRFDMTTSLALIEKALKKAKVDTEDAIQLLKQLNDLENRVKEIRLSTLIQIKNELTKEQQDQLKVLRTESDINGFTLLAPLNDNRQVKLQLGSSRTDAPQPLYVIVGHHSKLFVDRDFIDDMDQSQIESIEILKNAAAASIYGSKAKNGVVVIRIKDDQ